MDDLHPPNISATQGGVQNQTARLKEEQEIKESLARHLHSKDIEGNDETKLSFWGKYFEIQVRMELSLTLLFI